MQIKENILYLSITIALFILLILSLNFFASRERELFREELVRYDKYTVVRDMILHGTPDNDVIYHLMETNHPGWEYEEIIQMIEIARSY